MPASPVKLYQRFSLSVAPAHVVENFSKLNDDQVAKFFRKDMAKSHFALFMPAITETSCQHGNLMAAVPDESAQEMAGQSSSCPIVDTHIP